MRDVLLAISLTAGFYSSGQGQIAEAKPELTQTLGYSLAFKRADPVPSLTALWATEVPPECTSDGTVFLDMLVPAAVDAQPIASLTRISKSGPPIELLVSIPLSGEAHEFRLDQVSDLHDIHQKGFYASESDVVLLVNAAPEEKQGKETITAPDGTKH